jgi:hypothetical protein
MGSIFSKAVRVVIWLGSATNYGDVALEFLGKLYKDKERYLSEHPPLILTDEEQSGLVSLWEREWWSRIWVIQELCLAREAIVVCGDSHAPWEAIELAMEPERQLPSGVTDLPTELHILGSIRHASIGFARANYSRLGDLDLLVLINFRFLGATVALDKVYALLSITKNGGIIPDYTISPERCFTAAARTTLSISDNLDLLDFATPCPVRNHRRLPSWVPNLNYTLKGAERAIHVIDDLKFTRHDQPPFREFLNPGAVRFLDDDTLVLRGDVIDTVENLGEPLPCIDFQVFSAEWIQVAHPRMRVRSIYRLAVLLIMLKRWARRCLCFIKIIRAELLTMSLLKQMVDISLLSTPKPEDEQSRIVRLLDLLLYPEHIRPGDMQEASDLVRWLNNVAAIGNHRIVRYFEWFGLHDYFPRFHGMLLMTATLLYFSQSDEEFIGCGTAVMRFPGLRLSSTSDGRLCFTPHSCQVGDRVAVMRGGRHPYIVQDLGDTGQGQRWGLVGPCYLSLKEIK